MIVLGNCVLSDELYEGQFFCDLMACKGGCCVEGDSGAPVSEAETAILEEIAGRIVPYMIPDGKDAIERQGYWVKDSDGELTTPLVEGKQCAYVCFDHDGVAKCAIEMAWEAGVVDFQKPISCHLYPIRVKVYPHYDALNYHRWPLCDPARTRGRKKKVRVYRFLKGALVRKYGLQWYEDLEAYLRYRFGE